MTRIISLKGPIFLYNTSQLRCLHITPCLKGRPHGDDPVKNFDIFKWPNEVSTFEHYKMPQELLDNEFNYPICRDTMGIRWPGYWFRRKFVYVKEMEPELVVPDLTDFKLKPYVSYKTEEVDTPPFTAKTLFDAVYAPEIRKQFENNQLEKLELDQQNVDKARIEAMKVGSDMFEDHTIDGVRAPFRFIKKSIM